MLSIFLGNGIHLWTMGMSVLLVSMLGIAKPDHFGNMVIVLFGLYLVSSSIIGIASARFYKLFKGERRFTQSVVAAVIFPGIASGVIYFANIIEWVLDADNALDLAEIILILALQAALGIPLAMLGSFWGYNMKEINVPFKVNKVSKTIPD